MKKEFNIFLCLFFVAGLCVLGSPSVFAQGEAMIADAPEVAVPTGDDAGISLEGQDVLLVEEGLMGEIVSIDPEAATMTIKYLFDPEQQAFEEMSLTVTSATEIDKGGEMIGLGDLKVGDKISVQYSTQDDGVKEVIYIWLEG
ncbi:MAG: hypothetical protein WC552_02865 [Candidatus Omnitrophota bacterium]